MKHPVPDTHLDAAAARFRLLGDPVRLRLLNELLARGEASVRELAEATEQSHQNTSKHLRVLASGNVVESQRDGSYVRYQVSDPSIPGLCLLVCGQLKPAETSGAS